MDPFLGTHLTVLSNGTEEDFGTEGHHQRGKYRRAPDLTNVSSECLLVFSAVPEAIQAVCRLTIKPILLDERDSGLVGRVGWAHRQQGPLPSMASRDILNPSDLSP